jgi:hypothetical protein
VKVNRTIDRKGDFDEKEDVSLNQVLDELEKLNLDKIVNYELLSFDRSQGTPSLTMECVENKICVSISVSKFTFLKDKGKLSELVKAFFEDKPLEPICDFKRVTKTHCDLMVRERVRKTSGTLCPRCMRENKDFFKPLDPIETKKLLDALDGNSDLLYGLCAKCRKEILQQIGSCISLGCARITYFSYLIDLDLWTQKSLLTLKCYHNRAFQKNLHSP